VSVEPVEPADELFPLGDLLGQAKRPDASTAPSVACSHHLLAVLIMVPSLSAICRGR
jgi:hypothetical protein